MKLLIDRVIDTEVLVVGGGIAGCRAAVAAAEAGAQTVVALQGVVGGSGASSSPGVTSAWQAADGCCGPPDSPAVLYQDIMRASLGMADARLSWILANESADRLRELESWGFAVHPDPTGRHPHHTGYSCFGTQPRTHCVVGDREHGHTGSMVPSIARQFASRGVALHEHTMVIDMLVQDRVCVGALAVNEEGAFVAYRTGSVVLATGGAAQMFQLTRTPGEITGDGYAMAFRAGAELVNLEYMQHMILVVAGQPPRLGTPMWAAYPTLRNRLGEEVLTRYLPSGISAEEAMADRMLHSPFSCRDSSRWVDIAIATEVREGRGVGSGHMIVDFSGADLGRVNTTRPLYSHTSGEMTLGDPQIEVAHSGHAFNGGIRIDEWGRSTIPGLFAAGEASAGPHGADRLGGGMLPACNVFGARAGTQAAMFARQSGLADLRPEALETPEARLARFGRSGNQDWASIRRTLKAWCTSTLGVVRNACGLAELVDAASRLRWETLPNVPISDGRALQHVLETDDLLFVAELAGQAALLRTESRGSHFREDYPERDDTKWEMSLFWRNHDGDPVPFVGKYRQDPVAVAQVGEQRELEIPG